MSENSKNNRMTVEEFFHELIKGNDAPLKELEKLVVKESNSTYMLPENQIKALRERNYNVSELIQKVKRINEAQNNTNGLPSRAIEDEWNIPEGVITPHDMEYSSDKPPISPWWFVLLWFISWLVFFFWFFCISDYGNIQ